MFVSPVATTVYHVGAKRYLTKHGAYQAAAVSLIRRMRCDKLCDGHNDPDEGGPCNGEWPCCSEGYASRDVYSTKHDRLVKRLVRLMRKADKSEALSA